MIHLLFIPQTKEELKSIHIVADKHNVPFGNYIIEEYYCNERGCDCKHVYLKVRKEENDQAEAVICYRWTPNGALELAPMRKQGAHAGQWLDMITQLLKVDERYARGLEQRY